MAAIRSRSARATNAPSPPMTTASGTSLTVRHGVVKSPSSRSWPCRSRRSGPTTSSAGSASSTASRTCAAVSGWAREGWPSGEGAGGSRWSSTGSVWDGSGVDGTRGRSRGGSAGMHQLYRLTIYHDRVRRVTDADYRSLLGIRVGLRRFLQWSEQQAEAAGLTPARHQLLLAIRGLGGDPGPTIKEVAQALLLRHHSAVGLVDRAVAAGLIERFPDPVDHRVVRLILTEQGRDRLDALSELHRAELRRA